MKKPLDLIAHPEGGRYREVFRSSRTVTTAKGESRSALTHIYFSLDPGEVSRFHRVSSDEIWNLYQGSGLRLYLWDGSETPPAAITLSPECNCFCHVVPAGTWQAAEPLAETVLVGCSVAPGFEFTDFELLQPDTDPAALLQAIAPEMAKFVKPRPGFRWDATERRRPITLSAETDRGTIRSTTPGRCAPF